MRIGDRLGTGPASPKLTATETYELAQTSAFTSPNLFSTCTRPSAGTSIRMPSSKDFPWLGVGVNKKPERRIRLNRSLQTFENIVNLKASSMIPKTVVELQLTVNPGQ